MAKQIDDLEQLMRTHEQTVYMLMEFIDTKVCVRAHTAFACELIHPCMQSCAPSQGAETMFEPIAEECHNTLTLINAETIRVLQEMPVYSAATPY